MKKNLKKKKGFTLVELIIVIAVLGILAAIAVPRFGNVSKNAKVSTDKANTKILKDTATMLVAQDDVRLPANESTMKNKITEELNGIFPTPEASGSKFVVTVDEDGKVDVQIK